MVHPDATARENQTILDDTASHVGQIYFDQDLSDLVETQTPYSTNTQSVTTNAEDSIIDASLATGDAIVEYVMLGEAVADGVLAWISFGINTTQTSTPSLASTYYAEGGVENPSSGFPGGAPPAKN